MMKILMVGLGAIGQRHVRNIRTLYGDQVELIAYRARNQSPVLTDRMQVEAGEDLHTKYSILAFDDLDTALSQKPDITFICNPSSLHIPAALQAARAGSHLFIEKPLSGDLSGVAELQQSVLEQRLVAYVGYQMRFHPCLRRLHALLSAGTLGNILAVQVEVGEYLPAWHTYEDYRLSYAARSELGGGALLSQIHEFDYLYWFFGLPSRIFTVGGHLSSLELDVEDVASTLMEFHLDNHIFPAHVQQDYIQRPPSRTIQVIGEAGKIQVDLNALSLCRYDAAGQPMEDINFTGFQRNQLFLDELGHFIACVKGEQQPLVDLHAGAQSLRMALAAKQSLQSGAIVSL